MSDPIGSQTWLELHSNNPPQSNQFYTGLFGWSAANDNGDITFSSSGNPIATLVDSDQGPCWVPYFLVANLDQTSLKAYQMGAQMVNQGSLPDAKWAIMKDPTGVLFALWQNL